MKCQLLINLLDKIIFSTLISLVFCTWKAGATQPSLNHQWFQPVNFEEQISNKTQDLQASTEALDGYNQSLLLPEGNKQLIDKKFGQLELIKEVAEEEPGEAPMLRLLPASEQKFAPSVSISMPFANGFSWGNAGVGLGLQSRTRYTEIPDGGLGIGLGLGNPQKAIGFDVVASILDLSDFGRRGSLSFKIHRNFGNDFAAAIGLQNAIIWGYTDAGTSLYGVVTKSFRLKENSAEALSLIVVSTGLGGGQFRPETDINKNIESVGIFGSVALRVVEPLNAIVEWTGQDLSLGFSYVPFADTPLIVTGGLTDFTGNAGDGSRLLLRLGYLFTF